MARPASTPGLTPSVLDRLVDPESMGTTWQRGYSPQQMMEAVRRELEDLFNSHQSDGDIAEHFNELRESILAYGLPDLPSVAARSRGRPQEMRRIVSDVIARFEPRLRDVRVVLDEAALSRLDG